VAAKKVSKVERRRSATSVHGFVTPAFPMSWKISLPSLSMVQIPKSGHDRPIWKNTTRRIQNHNLS
jgi:hypothetical protein